MEIIIAKMFSVFVISVGLGEIMNRKYFKEIAEAFSKSLIATFIGGIAALLIGFGILSVHNIWSADWKVLITIIGWVAFIKGVWLIAYPQSIHSITKFKENSLFAIGKSA